MITEMEFLLNPISPERPCGEDLSFESVFDEIAEARREDDPTLDQGAWVSALKVADWPAVVDKTTAALTGRTKDLRLVGWLVEALGKTESFAGLAVGLDLLDKLCERYWTELHPQIENGDADARIGNFNWTIGRLLVLIRDLPLTSKARLEVSYNEYQAALTLKAAMERQPDDADRLAYGRITMADIHQAAGKSGDDFYRQLLPEQTAAKSAIERLAERLETELGADGPNFSPLISAFDAVRDLTKQLAGSSGIPIAEKPAKATAPSVGDEGGGDAPGPLRSRAHALEQLRQVAEFFRRTEPHSPVAYLADRAARWGEMPLHAWLRSVLKDEGSLSGLEELLGVERPEKDRDD